MFAISLGPDFGVKDAHLDAIGSKLGGSLLSMQLGSSDTGDGVHLSQLAVTRFVRRCPNLLVLKLESAVGVDDETFKAIVKACPKLQQLTVTGHDR